MNWNKGYTASCYMTVVDPVSWRDRERIEITGGTVSRSTAVLRESAQVDCINYDQTKERWIRIWMDARQEDSAEHVAIFTGLATSPDKNINGRLTQNTVSCYSVLKPAQDILLERGWYAPAGSNGARLAAKLLAVTPAPKEVEDNSPILPNAYIAEDNESNLSMAMKLIEAINWRIRITGDGVIHICPKASEAAASFDNLEYDVIEPSLTVTYDWYSCPNVFRAVMNGASAIARDDDPGSPFSTVSRGREIWQQDTSAKLNGSESLQAYAIRRLKELQNILYSVNYDRRYHPDLMVGDLVRLHYPEQSIEGLFTVTDQSIDLQSIGRTSEGVERYGSISAD